MSFIDSRQKTADLGLFMRSFKQYDGKENYDVRA